MSETASIISCSLLFFFLFLVPSAKSQAPAPAPGPASATGGPVNLTEVLEKGLKFKSFIHLLSTTQVTNGLTIQLNSSNQGMTVFAPTDKAFDNLKAGALNGLTSQQQVQLVLYHVTPKYYSLTDLLSVSNPVTTQAVGQNGKTFGLNFTGESNGANVSSGVVETQLENALRQQFPLAVYVVDKVLLPEEFFGAKAPSGAPAPDTSSSDVQSSAGDKHKSGSGRKGTAFGLVVLLACLCFGLLFLKA